MKKIELTILAIFIILSFSSLKAQENSQESVDIYGILYIQPRGMEGSPFLLKDWSMGSIELHHGRTANNVLLKFDILHNQLIYYNEKFKRIFIVDPVTIKSFVLNEESDQTMQFIKYKGPELGFRLKKDDLIHVLYKGDIQLLIKHTADISEANDINTKDKIFPKNLYFIQQGNELNEIKLKLKSLFKTFPDKKQAIKKQALQLRFRKKSEMDMLRLIRAIDKM